MPAKTYLFKNLIREVGNYAFWFDGEKVDISNEDGMHIIVKCEEDNAFINLLKERDIDAIEQSEYADLTFTKNKDTYTDTRL